MNWQFFTLIALDTLLPLLCTECVNVCKTTDETNTIPEHEHFRGCFSCSQWKLPLTGTRCCSCLGIGIVIGRLRKAFIERCPKVSLKFISGRVRVSTGRLLACTANRASGNVLSCTVGSTRHVTRRFVYVLSHSTRGLFWCGYCLNCKTTHNFVGIFIKKTIP